MGWRCHTTKEPRGLLGQTDLTSCEMSKVVMNNTEPVSTKKATERVVKILDITYENKDLELVAAKKTHMNSDERTKLLGLIKDFEDLFDINI